MSKRGASQGGRRRFPHPEMGRTTPVPGNAPFSLRLPSDLKARASEKASSKGLSVGQYVRGLVETDLTGATPRRRHGKYDGLRQDLAKVHGAIIACGNQVENMGRVCASERRGHPGGDPCRIDREQIIDLLKDVVSAVLLLARSIRAR